MIVHMLNHIKTVNVTRITQISYASTTCWTISDSECHMYHANIIDYHSSHAGPYQTASFSCITQISYECSTCWNISNSECHLYHTKIIDYERLHAGPYQTMSVICITQKSKIMIVHMLDHIKQWVTCIIKISFGSSTCWTISNSKWLWHQLLAVFCTV